MANKAAYFQLDIRMDGTYLILFPGENSRYLNYSEIDEYLRLKRIDFNKVEVMKALNRFSDECSVKLCPTAIKPVDETLIVKVDETRSQATGRFYPPSKNGKRISKEGIISSLVGYGVKFGVIEETVESFLKDRQYGQTYILAKAMPPVEGQSASITWHFNTDLSRKPKMNEDGSVDFHQLETVNPVHEGDCLATLTPAILGKPGIDVTGRLLKPANVKQMVLKQEKNTCISEDGCHLISTVDGHVAMISGSVFVSNHYEIPANVDTSTGDINFDGSVSVRGNVITGFVVRAKGDIIVDGVVEGAELYAEGQIILKRGIQGMGRGKLIAEGNILSKFIENAEVSAGGYIETDAILHSRVSARGEVTASGKKGFIVGGEIHSGKGISVKTAGSTMGTTTLLEVGFDPAMLEECERIEKKLPKMEAELEKVTKNYQALSQKPTPERAAAIQSLEQSIQQLQEKIKKSLERMTELQAITGEQSGGCVRISGVIYPGCKVVLYNTPYHIRSAMKYCRLIKDRADVKMVEYL